MHIRYNSQLVTSFDSQIGIHYMHYNLHLGICQNSQIGIQLDIRPNSQLSIRHNLQRSIHYCSQLGYAIIYNLV
jgi:hypothetical protein